MALDLGAGLLVLDGDDLVKARDGRLGDQFGRVRRLRLGASAEV
jgi:hypothetical protein